MQAYSLRSHLQHHISGGSHVHPLCAAPHKQAVRVRDNRCRSTLLPSPQLQEGLGVAGRQRPPSKQQQQQQQQQQHGGAALSVQHQPPQQQLHQQSLDWPLSRREAVVAPAASLLLLQLAASLAQTPPAAASKLGAAADSAWEAMGGGPADLTFPESWLGVWDVASTLVSVELPLGEEVLPAASKAAVQRAKSEDLNQTLQYQVSFVRNPSGRVVYDRRFNTAALLATYYGSNVDFAGRISWDVKDPNSLNLTLPGGLVVSTRVLRRSESELDSPDKFETSEYMQQVFDDGQQIGKPRVKASQCYTKYKFRDEGAAAAAGGPAIVATQVVSDFLTPFDAGGSSAYLSAANKPVVQYRYRMAFTRHQAVAQQLASVMHVS